MSLRIPLISLAFALAAGPAMAEDLPSFDLALDGTTFTPAELHVPAGKPFIIKFKNNNAGVAELEAKDFGIEKKAAGKSEVVVRVKAAPAGKYLFVDEFQEDVAKGQIVAE
jgi:hypothetical protein